MTEVVGEKCGWYNRQKVKRKINKRRQKRRKGCRGGGGGGGFTGLLHSRKGGG